MAVKLFHWKCGKVHLKIYSIQHAEIKYGYGSLPLKRPKKGTDGHLFQRKMLK